MEEFLGAPLAATGGQGLILFAAIREEEIVIPQEEIVFPQDARLAHLRRNGLHRERVFQQVQQSPDEYLMPRYAPFEALPDHWEQFSGDNYLGVQQHLQEEADAPEQVKDMDNEEEDSDDEEETKDCTKKSSQDVDAKSPATELVSKRDDPISDDDRLLKGIESPSSSVATIGLQDPAMPDASPAFGPILESVPLTTSEVQKVNM